MTDTDRTTELTITRVLDAPRDLVWRAWTEEDELFRWLSPMGTARASIAYDVREGGRYRYTMADETGKEYPTGGVFLEVVPPERLVFTWGGPDDPDDSAPVATVTLADVGGRTEMTFHLSRITQELRDVGVEAGWEQALDTIAAVVEGRA